MWKAIFSIQSSYNSSHYLKFKSWIGHRSVSLSLKTRCDLIWDGLFPSFSTYIRLDFYLILIRVQPTVHLRVPIFKMHITSIICALLILGSVFVNGQSPDCRKLRESCDPCIRRLNNPINNVEYMNNGCREKVRGRYIWRNQTRCDLQVIACGGKLKIINNHSQFYLVVSIWILSQLSNWSITNIFKIIFFNINSYLPHFQLTRGKWIV